MTREHVLPDVAGVVTAAELLGRPSTRSRRSSCPTATSRGSRAATPTRGTSSRPRWRSTSAAGTTRRARAYDWLARDAARRRRLARVLPRRRGRGPHARHQRHLLRRQRRVAPLPRHRRHRVPRASSGRRSSAAIDFALDYQTRTGEIAWRGRRPRRRRAAHRVVEHPPQPALRDRDRRAARPRTPRLGAVARLARHRDRAPARRVPRQGPLGDGLVLPDPRRRAARPRGRRARRVAVGDVRGRGPRRALRVGPAVDHRGRDVRAGDGARRDRQPRARPRSCSPGCSSCAHDDGGYWTGTNFDDDALPPSTASSTPSSSPRGTRPRSCSPPTRSAGAGPTAGLFRGEGLPEGLTADELLAAGVEIDRRARPHATAATRLASGVAYRRDGQRRADRSAARGRGGCRSSRRA